MERCEPRILLSGLGLTLVEDVEGSAIAATITGGAGPDEITATWSPETGRITINPNAECWVLDDTVATLVILGGDGDDVIRVRGGGGVVQYVVDGGPGNDRITGSNGHDWLQGGDGDDWLSGALGADYLAGGPGDDSLFGGSGGDVLVGGEGTDELWGGRGFDRLESDEWDVVVLGEELLADLASATPDTVVIDPDEVVTPL